MSESPTNNQAILRKATEVRATAVIVPTSAPERDRTLGLAASSAFLILARAFYEWATGAKPKCKGCGCKI